MNASYVFLYFAKNYLYFYDWSSICLQFHDYIA